METNNENSLNPEEQLRAADRATTLAWTEYPTLPRWSFLVIGAFFGLMIVALSKAWSSAAWSIALGALFLVVAGFIYWMNQRRGASARMVSMPKEFRPIAMWYLIALVAIIGIGTAVIVTVSPLVGGVAVALASAAGLDLYVRRYETVAAEVRSRVGTA